MKPGYRLLNDTINLETMDFGCATYIAEMMKACSERETSTVVRVIPEPTKGIGLIIMVRFHYILEVELWIHDNLADAMKSLD